MNPYLKFGIVFLVFTVVVIVITVATLVSLRKKSNQSQSTDTITKSKNVSFTSTIDSVTRTTINSSTSTGSSSIMTNETTMQSIIIISSQKSSHHSYVLTTNSNKFNAIRPCLQYPNYYEALEFNVLTTADYNFSFQTSTRGTITYYLYNTSFHPAFRYTNLIVTNENTEHSVNQNIILLLYTMTNYTLVMAPLYDQPPLIMSVNVTGPDLIKLKSVKITDDLPNYHVYEQSTLTPQSPSFCIWSPCPNLYLYHYYKAFQLNVSVTTKYEIALKSSTFAHSRLYDGTFRPFYPENNMVSYSFSTNCIMLEAMKIYDLVVYNSTHIEFDEFAINITGSGVISLFPINITETLSMTSLPQVEYTSSLTNESKFLLYQRPYPNSVYYYEIIQVNVSKTDYYAICSNSTILIKGDLYDVPFDPQLSQYPIRGGAGYRGLHRGHQFLWKGLLQSMTDYFLVISTEEVEMTGSFTISIISELPASLSKVD
ncbi:hypothetical protein I4U23_022277 [Adineta vaga]|nr:hypothetical protein I4U23_022277 [Adineta vaga]